MSAYNEINQITANKCTKKALSNAALVKLQKKSTRIKHLFITVSAPLRFINLTGPIPSTFDITFQKSRFPACLTVTPHILSLTLLKGPLPRSNSLAQFM